MSALHALIIEDHPGLAAMTAETLALAGIASTHACNAKHALEYLAINEPDVILLDIGLPDMTGWELLQAIKTSYGEYRFPIIVTTAFSDQPNRIIGRLQYVNEYLIKPFRPEELVNALSKVLETYKFAAV